MDLTTFLAGLGMMAGVITIILGLALSQVSDKAVWHSTGRKVSLLGAVLLACSAIIYGVHGNE